jgi:hypothetical protein
MKDIHDGTRRMKRSTVFWFDQRQRHNQRQGLRSVSMWSSARQQVRRQRKGGFRVWTQFLGSGQSFQPQSWNNVFPIIFGVGSRVNVPAR